MLSSMESRDRARLEQLRDRARAAPLTAEERAELAALVRTVIREAAARRPPGCIRGEPGA